MAEKREIGGNMRMKVARKFIYEKVDKSVNGVFKAALIISADNVYL